MKVFLLGWLLTLLAAFAVIYGIIWIVFMYPGAPAILILLWVMFWE